MAGRRSDALPINLSTWPALLRPVLRPGVAQRVPPPAVALGILAVLLFLTALMLLPAGLYVGDQGVKLLQIDALSRTGTLTLGPAAEPASIFRPEFSPFRVFVQVDDGFRTVYPPVYSLTVLPFYG